MTVSTEFSVDAEVQAAEAALAALHMRINDTDAARHEADRRLSEVRSQREALLERRANGEQVEAEIAPLRTEMAELEAKIQECMEVRQLVYARIPEAEAAVVRAQEGPRARAKQGLEREAQDIADEINRHFRAVEAAWPRLVNVLQAIGNYGGGSPTAAWLDQVRGEMRSARLMFSEGGQHLTLPTVGKRRYL